MVVLSKVRKILKRKIIDLIQSSEIDRKTLIKVIKEVFKNEVDKYKGKTIVTNCRFSIFFGDTKIFGVRKKEEIAIGPFRVLVLNAGKNGYAMATIKTYTFAFDGHYIVVFLDDDFLEKTKNIEYLYKIPKIKSKKKIIFIANDDKIIKTLKEFGFFVKREFVLNNYIFIPKERLISNSIKNLLWNLLLNYFSLFIKKIKNKG